MNRKLVVAFGLALGVGAGCGHAKSKQQGTTPAAESTIAPTGVPVGPTPSRVLQKGAAKKIQVALDKKGYSVRKTGHLDADTHNALEKFQKDQKMAATCLPDLGTLKLLGLHPKDVYRHER